MVSRRALSAAQSHSRRGHRIDTPLLFALFSVLLRFSPPFSVLLRGPMPRAFPKLKPNFVAAIASTPPLLFAQPTPNDRHNSFLPRTQSPAYVFSSPSPSPPPPNDGHGAPQWVRAWPWAPGRMAQVVGVAGRARLLTAPAEDPCL